VFTASWKLCDKRKEEKKIMPVPSYSRNRNKLAEQNEFEWSVGIKKKSFDCLSLFKVLVIIQQWNLDSE